MKKYKILITNDDGINADGIIKLAEAAKKFGEVWIIAPDGQRSAMSHRITYFGQIQVKEVDFPIKGVHSYSCSGTPADCVRIGIQKIVPNKPDIVFSGINYGYNIASDIQYSGTAGAAFEAVFFKVPAIAFSRNTTDSNEVTDAYLETVIEKYIEKPFVENQIWNVNFPGCSLKDCKGIVEDRMVSKDDFYADELSETIVENGVYDFEIQPGRNWKGTEGTDLAAIIEGYVSVGPVKNIE